MAFHPFPGERNLSDAGVEASLVVSVHTCLVLPHQERQEPSIWPSLPGLILNFCKDSASQLGLQTACVQSPEDSQG